MKRYSIYLLSLAAYSMTLYCQEKTLSSDALVEQLKSTANQTASPAQETTPQEAVAAVTSVPTTTQIPAQKDLAEPTSIMELPESKVIKTSEEIKENMPSVPAPETQSTVVISDIQVPEAPVMEKPKEVSAPSESIQDPKALEAKILNVLLIHEYILYSKTLKFHWNVTGQNFYSLSKLFKKQSKQLFTIIDHLAQRIRSLDSLVFENPELIIAPRDLQANKQDKNAMIQQLLHDHESIIITLQGHINTLLPNQLSELFLQKIVLNHQKMAWQLRASLEQ